MRKTNSKQFIVTALFNLMETNRYADITISQICHTAGVTRKTYYKYFYESFRILDYFFEEMDKEFQSKLSKCKTSEEYYYVFFKKWRDYGDYFKILINQNMHGYIIDNFQKYTVKYADKHNDYTCNYIAYMFFSLIYTWSIHNFEDPIESLVDFVGKKVPFK